MRALAEVTADLDVFLSTYLPSVSRKDVEMNASFIRSRVEAIRNALSGELEEDFDRTFVVDEERYTTSPSTTRAAPWPAWRPSRAPS